MGTKILGPEEHALEVIVGMKCIIHDERDL